MHSMLPNKISITSVKLLKIGIMFKTALHNRLRCLIYVRTFRYDCMSFFFLCFLVCCFFLKLQFTRIKTCIYMSCQNYLLPATTTGYHLHSACLSASLSLLSTFVFVSATARTSNNEFHSSFCRKTVLSSRRQKSWNTNRLILPVFLSAIYAPRRTGLYVSASQSVYAYFK